MGLHIDASRHYVSTTRDRFARGETINLPNSTSPLHVINRETLVSKYQARRDSTDFSGIGKRLNQLINSKESGKAEKR